MLHICPTLIYNSPHTEHYLPEAGRIRMGYNNTNSSKTHSAFQSILFTIWFGGPRVGLSWNSTYIIAIHECKDSMSIPVTEISKLYVANERHFQWFKGAPELKTSAWSGYSFLVVPLGWATCASAMSKRDWLLTYKSKMIETVPLSATS